MTLVLLALPEAAARAAGAPSPFTGETAPPAGPPLPLPPAPPPTGGVAPSGAQALPPAPAPRAAPAAARPGMPGSDLPPPPRQARGVHLHDGFYLRMGLGVAYSGALVSSDSKSIGDYSFSGFGDALDLSIGGTPTPGLVLGGALSAFAFKSSSRSVSSHSVSGDVTGSTGMLGVFVDGFPDPERGFHFGGALGAASGATELKDTGNKFAGGGLGLEAWAGYDFWASAEWSLGGTARLMGSVTRQDTDSAKYESSIGALSLSFTALYH